MSKIIVNYSESAKSSMKIYGLNEVKVTGCVSKNVRSGMFDIASNVPTDFTYFLSDEDTWSRYIISGKSTRHQQCNVESNVHSIGQEVGKSGDKKISLYTYSNEEHTTKPTMREHIENLKKKKH